MNDFSSILSGTAPSTLFTELLKNGVSLSDIAFEFVDQFPLIDGIAWNIIHAWAHTGRTTRGIDNSTLDARITTLMRAAGYIP